MPGVTAVVDAGLHKVARYDADRGIDSLETERITTDAADQRAGRAGRLAPGRRAAAVGRARSAAAAPRAGDSPRRSVGAGARRHRVGRRSADARVVRAAARGRARRGADAARAPRLVRSAIRSPASGPVHLTPIGEQVRRLPLHPRLARMLVAAGGARQIARACALLSERHLLPPRTASTTSRSAVGDRRLARRAAARAARGGRHCGFRIADCGLDRAASAAHPRAIRSDDDFRRAILAGYPDRVAQRREPGSPNVPARVRRRRDDGAGERRPRRRVPRRARRAAVAAQSQSRESADPAIRNSRAVRLASRVEREWLHADVVRGRASIRRATRQGPRGDRRALRRAGARRASRSPSIRRSRRALLAERVARARSARRGRAAAAAAAVRGRDVDLDAPGPHGGVRRARARRRAHRSARSPPTSLRDLDRDAPESLAVPSGRRHRARIRARTAASRRR